MKAAALLVVVPALLAQPLSPSPHEILNLTRPLTRVEIALVLAASRQALSAKTFRLSFAPGDRGIEVLMGPDGRPKIARAAFGVEAGMVSGIATTTSAAVAPATVTRWHEDLIHIVDYTGERAHRCDGSVEQGELVIEYEHHSSTNAWTATARRRGTRDLGWPGIAPVFEMLLATAPMTSGERRQIGVRFARAFVSPWTPPPPDSRSQAPRLGDPMPNVAGDPPPDDSTQTLWIDTETFLPLRWEATKRGMVMNGFIMTYETIDLRPPAGIDAPACIR
jgi:hypothetical protein